MSRIESAPFRPDWVSPPGETIADLLEERSWSQAELAARMGVTPKHVSCILSGQASVSEEVAIKLERVLGGSADFWLRREHQFRLAKRRKEDSERLLQWTSWLRPLPVKALMQAGYLPKQRIDNKNKPEIVERMLAFFSVASPDEWNQKYLQMDARFRRHEQRSDMAAISAWLRLGEISAEEMTTPPYNARIFKRNLKKMRALTLLPIEKFEPELKAYCAEAGVRLIFVPAIRGARVSGVARWLGRGTPMIQLSLLGKWNDMFWFTFFHECAHLILHDKRSVYIDEIDKSRDIPRSEEDADKWAKSLLIPSEHDHKLADLTSKKLVKDFAHQIGIHPGIVVGRLQHERTIPFNWMNDLRERLEFAPSPCS